MPSSLSLTIGANTITIPVKGTNTLVNAAIMRYALARGISVEGRTATEIGEDVLRSLLKTVRDTSIDRHRVEKLAETNAAIEAEIITANDL